MAGRRLRAWYDRVQLRGVAPRLTLVVLSGTIALVVVGVVAIGLVRQHERLLGAARLATQKEAGMLAEYAGRQIGAVDVMLRATVATLEGTSDPTPGRADDVLRSLSRPLATLPQIRCFAVFDASGKPLFGWPAAWPLPDETTTRLIEVHRTMAPEGPYVTAWRGRMISDQPTILLTRRFERPDGSLAGLVVADIDLAGFQGLRTTAAVGQAVLAVWSDGGQVLVRHPNDDVLLGAEVRRAIFARLADADGITLDIDRWDGGRSILSYRRVPGLPLTALSVRDRSHAMAEWSLVLRNHAAAVAVVLATLLVLTLLALSQMIRRQKVDDRLRAAISAGMDAFFILRSVRDGEGRVHDFVVEDLNARGERLLMRRRDQAIGRCVSGFVSVERPERFMGKLIGVVETGRPVEQEFTLTEGPKGAVHMHHQIVPLGDGVAVTTRNVTRQKRVEAELRAAKDAAEAANRAKSDFLANMSHELRTPLNAIIGFSESMLLGYFGAVPPKQHGYIKSIHDAGSHLLGVINDVLDLSKIEAGKAELTEDVFDLEAGLDAVIALVQVKAAEKQLTIDTSGVAGPARLRGDALKLKQVLINLLSNAVKFTRAGGRIAVSAGRDAGGDFVITVADDGIGIAAGDIAKAMMPFGQVEQTYVRSQGGTGLGLPLAKSLVEMHGGTLALTSAPGKGTIVMVRLPAARIVDTPLPAEPRITRYAS